MKGVRKPPSPWKRFRYRLEAAFLELLAVLIPLLSRKMLVRIANVLGWVAFHLLGRERDIALMNLDLAFGSTKSAEEKRRIARSSFQTFARTFLGLFWGQRLNRATLDSVVEFDVEGLRLVEEVRARGKGIMFITLHYGEWEVLGLATALRGFTITIVTEEMRNPHAVRILDRLRGHAGSRIISQRFAMTKLLKALKRGECIALLVDLNAMPNRGGLWLDFFGKPVFSYSTAALALRTDAPIVAALAHPLPDGRVRVVYGPEITCTPTGNEEEDLHVLSQKCLQFCEQSIRQRPEFWLWIYRRWKFRPTADPSGYPKYSHYAERIRPRGENVESHR